MQENPQNQCEQGRMALGIIRTHTATLWAYAASEPPRYQLGRETGVDNVTKACIMLLFDSFMPFTCILLTRTLLQNCASGSATASCAHCTPCMRLLLDSVAMQFTATAGDTQSPPAEHHSLPCPMYPRFM